MASNLFAPALANLDFPSIEDRWTLTGMLYSRYSQSEFSDVFLPNSVFLRTQEYARESAFLTFGHRVDELPAVSLAVLFRCLFPGRETYPVWNTKAAAEVVFPWLVKLGFPFDRMQVTVDAILYSEVLDHNYAEVNPFRMVVYNAFTAAEFDRDEMAFDICLGRKKDFLKRFGRNTLLEYRNARVEHLQGLLAHRHLFYEGKFGPGPWNDGCCRSNIERELTVWNSL